MLEVDGLKREELDAVIEKTMREQEETGSVSGSGWDVWGRAAPSPSARTFVGPGWGGDKGDCRSSAGGAAASKG